MKAQATPIAESYRPAADFGMQPVFARKSRTNQAPEIIFSRF
jgi:hypothetical protein